MKKTVGRFNISVWEGGYPCHCEIEMQDRGLKRIGIKFDHRDLSDLEHAVKEMRRAAKHLLRGSDKDEA